jgi:hypothetical protein
MSTDFRTGLINSYPAGQAASIMALAAFNVVWVSRGSTYADLKFSALR